MYKLFNYLTLPILLAEIPALIVSLCITEFFYKFHSFTIETFAFGCTWYAISFLVHQFSKQRKSK